MHLKLTVATRRQPENGKLQNQESNHRVGRDELIMPGMMSLIAKYLTIGIVSAVITWLMTARMYQLEEKKLKLEIDKLTKELQERNRQSDREIRLERVREKILKLVKDAQKTVRPGAVPLFDEEDLATACELQDGNKKIPASARSLQETRVNALSLALHQVKHVFDQPLRCKDLRVVRNALFGFDQIH